MWWWLLIGVMAVLVLAGGAWLVLMWRDSATEVVTIEDDAPETTGGTAQSAHGRTMAEDDGTAPADDAAETWGLDADEWAPMAPRRERLGRARGLLRGGTRLAKLAGEPAVLFESSDGTVLVGLPVQRPYGGRPAWREISALTLQMGLAERRWPGAEVRGVVRYSDRAVPLAYSPALFADLKTAASEATDGELPNIDSVRSRGIAGQAG